MPSWKRSGASLRCFASQQLGQADSGKSRQQGRAGADPQHDQGATAQGEAQLLILEQNQRHATEAARPPDIRANVNEKRRLRVNRQP